MKENNEVMQGDNTALRALRANKSPCDVGVVLSVLKDTKELNAGIAIIALQNMRQQEGLSDNQLEKCMSLSERLTKTALYKYDGEEQDQSGIHQAFVLIEEYLKEQGV